MTEWNFGLVERVTRVKRAVTHDQERKVLALCHRQ